MRDEMASTRVLSVFAGMLATIALLAAPPAHSDDLQQLDSDFAKRMFAGNAPKPKTYACFVRRYDAAHLAQHPLQKVSVMKLLITAEKEPDDKVLEYSFRLGVNFRDRAGDFDSSGECGHAAAIRALNPDTDLPVTTGIDFNCSVDCDGGGIAVNLANSDASMIVKLDRITIWKGNSPDENAKQGLQGGADDKVFRLDRTGLNECTPLVADRKELAAMRHK
jgi:hypothetical protein